jgi:DNA-binding response OmpR family regulator
LNSLIDQLKDVVNGLLEITGERPVESTRHEPSVPVFKAEMRRYRSGSEVVNLSEVEALILDELLQNRGQLVTKTQLCQVLGIDPVAQERNLKSYVHRLKAKLNTMQNPGVKIQPIHGAGYVITEVNEN